MDRPISAGPPADEGAGRFYDSLAPHYDAMTGFERRFEQERPFFKGFVDRHGVRTAVDAGAGTGFHSLLLAQLGVKVIAVDVSGDMLALARAHAAAMGLDVETARCSLLDLAVSVAPDRDAVVCMGNTLAHFTEPGSLEKVLDQFRRVLRGGGVLLIQTLNFDAIMRRDTHTQSVKQVGDIRFIREYMPAGNGVEFRITRAAAEGKETVTSMLLAPVYSTDLTLALSNAGFSGIEVHGSLAMDSFSPDSSRDLVALCKRA
jgi:glycine/sarcosine N-methyltransferase